MKLIEWIKSHKLTTGLLILIFYFIYKNYIGSYMGLTALDIAPSYQGRSSVGSTEDAISLGVPAGVSNSKMIAPIPPISGDSDAAGYQGERLVVTNSSLSLLVKDVRVEGQKILDHAKSVGGFMVQANYNRPTESPFATLTVRVPSDKLESILEYYRSLGVKVTNENLIGTDVTEQYVDIEAHLEPLSRTKIILEGLLTKTENIDQILRIQRELISTQSQIDSYVGRQKALTENAAFARLTIYLSTDELALPYTPDQTFRPAVIFKLAVRSLMRSLYKVGEIVIWLVVYSVIWVPVLVIYKVFKNWNKNRNLSK